MNSRMIQKAIVLAVLACISSATASGQSMWPAANVQVIQNGSLEPDTLQNVYYDDRILWGTAQRRSSFMPLTGTTTWGWRSAYLAPTNPDQERENGGVVFDNYYSSIWGTRNNTILWATNGDSTQAETNPGNTGTLLTVHGYENGDFSLASAVTLDVKNSSGTSQGDAPYDIYHGGNSASAFVEVWRGTMDVDAQTDGWVEFDQDSHLGGAPREIADNGTQDDEQFTLDPGTYHLELTIAQAQTSRMCSLYVWTLADTTATTLLSAIPYLTVYLGHNTKTVTVESGETLHLGVYAGSCAYTSNADGEVVLFIRRLR